MLYTINKRTNMKTLLTIILLSCLVQAQEKTEVHSFYIRGDSLEAICKERGHIKGNVGGVTCLASIPRYIDLPDKTIVIYSGPNTISYRCQRCGKGFSEPVQVKPGAVIIWQK
jgi:hypothetical protein